jgi:hypothetical protein
MVRQAVTATLPPLDRPSLGTSWFLGEELVQDREGHVAEQGGEHAPNALGNFEFDVTLSYRRLERPRRVTDGG